MGRHPSDAALGAAANGDWASHATCRNQPDYTSNNPDSITTLRAAAAWSVFGYNCTHCGQAPDNCTCPPLKVA